MITRTTLLSGPATATFRGHTFSAQDGIVVTPALELEAVESQDFGPLDATVTQGPVTISFAPVASFADLLALYPFLDGAPGTSLFGATDEPLILTAANGTRLTFRAVAITQMPNLALTTRGVVADVVTFLARGARHAALTDMDRLVSIDTVTPPTLNTAPAQLSDDFEITWGDTPWAELQSQDGIDLTFQMSVQPVLSAANAFLDATLESLKITATFTPGTPDGPAESDVFTALQAQGPNASPSRLLSQGASPLEIAGEHLFVRLPLAQLTAGTLTFNTKNSRVGNLAFTATRALMGSEPALDGLVGLTEGAP